VLGSLVALVAVNVAAALVAPAPAGSGGRGLLRGEPSGGGSRGRH
jgi:hypothetical protein